MVQFQFWFTSDKFKRSPVKNKRNLKLVFELLFLRAVLCTYQQFLFSLHFIFFVSDIYKRILVMDVAGLKNKRKPNSIEI